ncbi:MAG TPA: 2-oxoglutarate dehydrogenase, E2 component, dihydrolipoamide succinyltransferase [Candidatus Polarisedimenticolia bacterium]|nr:2-oxoglutarate dehydrogenase, E2 component, dihydrolipoamide succinyltransferase [Candidatus Polarisedimenticolia bacterium]
MRVDVIMPQMGESIAEGTLTRWLKKAGERVARDEPIFEISTDKVDAEIPAPAAGTLVEVKVKEGETVPVNTVVALIETEAGAAVAAAKTEGGARPASPPPVSTAPRPTAPPREAPGMKPAPAIAPVPASSSAGPVPVPRAAALAGGGATVDDLRRVRSSPLVRRMAREHNLDLTRIQGTGISGRVTRKDIQAVIESGGAPVESGAAAAPAVARAVFAPGERVSVVPMTPMRKKIAEHMVLSRRTSAHVTTVFEVDMNRVTRLREEHRQEFQNRHGVKLTVTPFLVKAAVEALKAFPIVNASIDGDNVVYKKDVNIGVAVALEWGLIVPVVRHADDLSLSGIAKAVGDLAERARSKKLSPDDVQGGTFTITNPGIYGALFGTPIISQPQVAIMGVGAITKRPVVIEDAIAIRPIVNLTLSFDHRLIDGAVADQFMAHIKETLQEGKFPAVV